MVQTEHADHTSVGEPTNLSLPAPSRPENEASSRRTYAVLAPLFVLLILWIWLFYGEGAFKGGPGGKALGGDYAMFISAARLIHSQSNPYDPALLIHTETNFLQQLHAPPIDGKQRSHVRVGNPPLMYWAMEPLIDRPFVLTAWVSLLSLYALSALGFIAVLRYYGWRNWILPTVVFLLMPQVVLAAFYGNPVAIVFAAIGLALALSRRYPVLAGVLLSAAWLKPPVALPAVLLIALFYVPQRLRLAAGFAGATTALLLATIATTGVHSLGLWIRGLTQYSNDMSIQPDVISLNGLYLRWMTSGPRLALEAATLIAALAITAYYWQKRGRIAEKGIWLAPLWLVWMLAAPYGHFFDEVILAIPVLAVLGKNGEFVSRRIPATVLYLLFCSLLVISWMPINVHLLPLPLLAVAALMVKYARRQDFATR
jgi:Glycosyltransferase family 87